MVASNKRGNGGKADQKLNHARLIFGTAFSTAQMLEPYRGASVSRERRRASTKLLSTWSNTNTKETGYLYNSK